MATMFAMGIILTSQTACRPSEVNAVFDNSVDVRLDGWASTDTLFYPFAVTDPATVTTPVLLHHPYRMKLSVRHSSDYPLLNVPFLLLLQQTDTSGGYLHPIKNLLHLDLAPEVRDTTGMPQGTCWGSLYTTESTVPGHTFRFDSAGFYRFLVIPQIGSQQKIPGIASIGIRLE